MQLMIQENFTHKLADSLKQGEVDAIIIALPFDEPGIVDARGVRRAFPGGDAAGPSVGEAQARHGRRADRAKACCCSARGIASATRCSRFCASVHRSGSGLQRSLEGGSLETIRQMVASGVGLTVLPEHLGRRGREPQRPDPRAAVRAAGARAPRRASRGGKSFPRPEAIEALRQAILECDLPQVRKIRGAA